MSTLLMTAILFAFAGFAALLMKKRFEEQLPLAVGVVVLVLYVFGLLNALHAGVYAVLLMAAAALTGQAVLLIRGRMRPFWKQLFTPGCMAFFLIALWLLISYKGYMFHEWDDFSHWGIAVKNMSIFGAIPSAVPESTVVYRDYPPATTLFSWIWSHLSGAFNEEDCQRALNMMMLCFLLPAMREQEWKKPGKALCMSSLLFMFPMAFAADVYQKLQVDTLLGCMLLYVLYAWFLCERSKAVHIGVGCTLFLLPLVKGTGMAMAGVMLAAMTVEVFVRERKERLKKLRPVLFFALITVSAKLSWDFFLRVHQVGEQWNLGNVALSEMLLALVGKGRPSQENIIRIYIDKLASVQLIGNPYTLQLSFIHWIVLLCGVSHWLITSCDDAAEQKSLRSVYAVLFAGMAGFVVANLWVSLFLFRYDEAVEQGSLGRYLASFLIPMIGWTLFVIIQKFERKNKAGKEHAVFCVMMGVLILTSPMTLVQKTVTMAFRNQTVYATRMTELISQNALDTLDAQKDRVYVVATGDDGRNYYRALYQLTPVHVQDGMQTTWVVTEKNNNSRYEQVAIQYSVEEWAQVLADGDFTHVYLDEIDDPFINDYQTLFETRAAIEEGMLYRIEKTEQGIKLCRAY